ncbi:MAG: hypothetical protein H6R19_2326 [Proteobacteria bacterium]|nr:hypothetical protein [Pseudomonadota bacterium]
MNKVWIPALALVAVLGACDSIKIQKTGYSPLSAEGVWQFEHPEIKDSRTALRDSCMATMFQENNPKSRLVRCSMYAACQITPARSPIIGTSEKPFCDSISRPSKRWDSITTPEQLMQTVYN